VGVVSGGGKTLTIAALDKGTFKSLRVVVQC
jgi:hypothetical protein